MASSSSAHETEDFDLSEKDESWLIFFCFWFCFGGVGLTFGLLCPGVTSVNFDKYLCRSCALN